MKDVKITVRVPNAAAVLLRDLTSDGHTGAGELITSYVVMETVERRNEEAKEARDREFTQAMSSRTFGLVIDYAEGVTPEDTPYKPGQVLDMTNAPGETLPGVLVTTLDAWGVIEALDSLPAS